MIDRLARTMPTRAGWRAACALPRIRSPRPRADQHRPLLGRSPGGLEELVAARRPQDQDPAVGPLDPCVTHKDVDEADIDRAQQAFAEITRPVGRPDGRAAPRGKGPDDPLLHGRRLSSERSTASAPRRQGETLGVVASRGAARADRAVDHALIPQPRARSSAAGSTTTDHLLELPRGDAEDPGQGDLDDFPEPMTSSTRSFTVGEQIAEALRLHEGLNRRDALDRAIEMLRSCTSRMRSAGPRVPPPALGRMRQRVHDRDGVRAARSSSSADEPTTALEVTIQAQILELLNELKARFGWRPPHSP